MPKDMLPNVRSMASYDEVLLHIATHHGDEGRRVAVDPNEAPMIWHEIAHVDPSTAALWDHEHYGTDQESITRMMATVTALAESPELEAIMEEFIAENPDMMESAEETRRKIAGEDQ